MCYIHNSTKATEINTEALMIRSPTNVWELTAMRPCCSEQFKLLPLRQLVIRITGCLYSHSYELQILCSWNTINTELPVTTMLRIQINHFFTTFLPKKKKKSKVLKRIQCQLQIYLFFSPLHRAHCFNYFLNIPTHVHNIYTVSGVPYWVKPDSMTRFH